MSSKTSVLEPLRVRIRRFQFIVGLGFISLVVGSVLSVSLTLRLSVRVQALPLGGMRLLMAVLLENLWVLVVLPGLCYAAARVMELKPWSTGGGGAASGAAFVLALNYVQSGTEGLWLGGLGSVLNVVAFGVGVVLSARAVMMGRAAASQQVNKAQAKAQERKSEYDEFLRAAEEGGARLEQREAAVSGAGLEQRAAEAGGAPLELREAAESGARLEQREAEARQTEAPSDAVPPADEDVRKTPPAA
ncbi:hypothetical protein [Pyxidicoccus parkwayensis]|uniref:hypothetical protein n=1 Tax=Pyxidicoccus parkwayensis TaxID=2813578 RepID=UPI001F510A4D|nr:hypothetical protein [Pyxidicoccus parkwaysis]